MKNPLIVALDLDDEKKAQILADDLSEWVGGFKVGPRLTLGGDPTFLKRLSEKNILFFDHKFFDIPSTTVSAVKRAAQLGAHWVTVHALNGLDCLKELGLLQKEIRKTRQDFRVLAVTVLTSFNEKNLPPVWRSESISSSVESLARCAVDAGLDSLVCSPHEIKILKEQWPGLFLVVPGIRPEGSATGDQKRSATPKEALEAGASALVVGRPVLESRDPVEAVKTIISSLG